MSDKLSNDIYPPTHELHTFKVVRLFLCRFIGEYIADFYQIRPCNGEGVESINLFLGESLAWMVLQGCLNDIAAQTHATFSGEFMLLLGAAESVYFRLRFSYNILFLHKRLNRMSINKLQRWTASASLRVVRETFSNIKSRSLGLYYKRISRKVPIK